MVVEGNGIFDDLFGFKIAQINSSQAGVGLVVDEQPITIIVTGRLTQRWVMV